MPQDGSSNYYYPPGTPGIPDQTIESEAYNTFLNDLVTNDLNIPRPVHRGGTGANVAEEGLVNLTGEKATQVVTNFDSHFWLPGSFRSSNVTGQAAPVDGHAFAGICYLNEPFVYPPTNQNLIVEARDQSDTTVPGRLYIREKKAGTWDAWVEQVGGITDLIAVTDASYVNVAGDTMTGQLTLPVNASPAVDHAVRQDYVTGYAVAKAGDTMTGLLTLSAAPTSDLHASTKKYVDDQIALCVKKAGDTITGELIFDQATAANAAWTVKQAGVTKASCLIGGNGKFSTDIGIAGPDPSIVYWDSAWTNAQSYVWFETATTKLKLQMSAPNGGGDAYLTSGALGVFSMKAAQFAHDPSFSIQYDPAGVGTYYFGFKSGTWITYDDTNGLIYRNAGNLDMQVSPGGILWMWGTNAYKYVAGDWSATSDERIKNVVGDYEKGLDAIKQIQPVRYTYKGNDTYGDAPPQAASAPYPSSPGMQVSRDVKEFIGLIAQPVETVMPEMVSKMSAYIDGQPVNDLRTLDTSSLIYALVNAVKELTARVEQLEQ